MTSTPRTSIYRSALVVAVVIVAIALLVVGPFLFPYWHELLVLQEINAVGGEALQVAVFPSWISFQHGEQIPFFRRIYSVDFSRATSDVPPKLIERLSIAKRLVSLTLPGDKINADHFHGLKQLKSLELLDLRGTRLTDDDLDDIARLTRLQSLSLESTAITDRGLKKLRYLRRLTQLNLTRTNTTEKGRSRYQHVQPDCKIITDRPNATPSKESSEQAAVSQQPAESAHEVGDQ